MVEQLAFEACSQNSLAGGGGNPQEKGENSRCVNEESYFYGGSGQLSWWLVSWCFKPSQPQRIITGLREISIKRYIVEMTYMAEIRPEE